MKRLVHVKTMCRSASRSAVALGVLAILNGTAAYADSTPAAPATSPASTPVSSPATTPNIDVTQTATPVAPAPVVSASPADATAPSATTTPAPTASAPAAAQPTASMVPTDAAGSALKQKATDVTQEKNLDQTFKAAEQQYSLSKQGSWSVIYDFGYSYYSNTALDLALDSSSSTIDRLRVENNAQHSLTNTFTLQYGILNNLTLTAAVPLVAKINPPTDGSTAGLGDLSFGARWEPYPLGTTPLPVTFFGNLTLPTGSSPYAINPLTELSTGEGYYSVGGGVSTRKFIDPIVLFGTLSANYGLEKSGLEQAEGDRILNSFSPGYTVGMGFGFAYSLNYDVSLTVSYQQSFLFGSSYHFSDGTNSTSSAESAATINTSLGVRISPKTIVNASVGFGLTPDSPNVTLGLSLPLDFLGIGRQVQ